MGGLQLRFTNRSIQSETPLSDSLKLFAERIDLPTQDHREAVCFALKEAMGAVLYNHVVVGAIRDDVVTVITDSQSCYQSITFRKTHLERALTEALDGKKLKLRVEHSKMLT